MDQVLEDHLKARAQRIADAKTEPTPAQMQAPQRISWLSEAGVLNLRLIRPTP